MGFHPGFDVDFPGRDGVTFLDKLRQVLTQIGNSLGYVRMVRTAGMRSMADGLEYLEARVALAKNSGQTLNFLILFASCLNPEKIYCIYIYIYRI